jgi:hypothetical protein
MPGATPAVRASRHAWLGAWPGSRWDISSRNIWRADHRICGGAPPPDIDGTTVHIGGSSRVCYRSADHALRSASGRGAQAHQPQRVRQRRRMWSPTGPAGPRSVACSPSSLVARRTLTRQGSASPPCGRARCACRAPVGGVSGGVRDICCAQERTIARRSPPWFCPCFQPVPFADRTEGPDWSWWAPAWVDHGHSQVGDLVS